MRRERSRSALAVEDKHGQQQDDVQRHDQPAVRHAQTVDQTQDQRDEVVRHLLLGDRTRPQPDDGQYREQAEAHRDVHPDLGEQRHRHEDADVQCDVGQEQVRAPMAAEVQDVGHQEDGHQVDDEVGHDAAVSVQGQWIPLSTPGVGSLNRTEPELWGGCCVPSVRSCGGTAGPRRGSCARADLLAFIAFPA